VIEVTPTPVKMVRYWLKKLVKSTKLEVFMLEENRGDLQFMVTLDKAQLAWDRCMGGHATGKLIIEM
jgi:hypothetical protein